MKRGKKLSTGKPAEKREMRRPQKRKGENNEEFSTSESKFPSQALSKHRFWSILNIQLAN